MAFRLAVAAEAFRVLKPAGVFRIWSASGGGRLWLPAPDPMHVEDVAEFLAACPPPVHTSDAEAWRRRVEAELCRGALPGLIELLEIGSPAEQDAAMATARALGAEVWAVGAEPELEWQVTLPGEVSRMMRPRRRARRRQL